MTREEKKRELTRMLKKAPEILSPRKAAQWSPLGRNAVYDLIHSGELRSFRYRDSYIIAKDDLIEYLLDHADDTDTGGKTRRFAVRAEDLAAYMNDAAKHPERYTTPYAAFSSVKGKAKTVPDKPAYPTFPRELPEDFRLWLEDEWCGADDLLTNDEAAELTGYAVTTVDNHIRAGRLKAVHTQDGLRIPKAWLVEFMCGHGYAIRLKSQRHCEMLGRYFAGGE